MDHCQQFPAGDALWIVSMLKMDTDLVTGTSLILDVHGYRRIFADINRNQSWLPSYVLQRLHSSADLILDHFSLFFSVDNLVG